MTWARWTRTTLSIPTQPDLDRRLQVCDDFHDEPTTTRLRVFFAQRVAAVSEIAENTGPSVTNCAEHIARSIEGLLGVDFDAGWTLIEHYEANQSRAAALSVMRWRHRDRAGLPQGLWWQPLLAELAWVPEALVEARCEAETPTAAAACWTRATAAHTVWCGCECFRDQP